MVAYQFSGFYDMGIKTPLEVDPCGATYSGSWWGKAEVYGL